MMHSITNDRAKTDNGTKYTGIRILAVLFWIAIWQFASMYLKQEILLASPVSVVRKLFELIFSGNFWQSVGFSFVRIVTGFLLAVLLGIFLAILAYWSKTVEILIAPVIAVVKSTPVTSFIILCLIWIPSRNLSVFISFLMVLPVIYTNILEGIRQTDRKILEMAKVFRVNLRRQIRYIYVSQVLPYFLSACRLSLGMCWKAGVAAEVIGVPSGSIGEKLYNAKIYLNTPDLFAWTIVIIVISFVFEKCFLGIVSRIVYMIQLLLRLDVPDKGKIEGISDRKLSAVFQEDRLCENLSAASNIRLVCTKTISDRELEEAYKAVALTEVWQKPVRELSGGMRRRVSILRALLAESDCVIMDEPLRGLDEKTRAKTIDYILKKTERKTLIFVTHEEKEAVWLKADRTVGI